MLRYIACLAVALLAATAVRAGELDSDFRPAAPARPAVQPKAFLPVNALARAALPADNHGGAPKASELDSETPDHSWRGWGGGRGGWGGWHGGWRGGWGGWHGGWGGWRGGWGGWGGWHRGWYGGWGGWYGGWGRGYGWGWGGYPYYAYSAYYPLYFGYGFYGYPGWGYCW